MGEYKWQELGYKYQLKDTPTPTAEELKKTLNIFRKKGIRAA
jgi:pyruvate formate lyase activating enzyme